MKKVIKHEKNDLNNQAGFFKAIFILVGGTTFASGLSVIVLPILTRLYTVENFSELAVYTSLVSLFSVIACLRYEIAIPLGENKEEVSTLFIISVINSLLFSVFIFLILFFFKSKFISLNHFSDKLIWMLPLSIFLMSLYSSLKYLATKYKKFHSIALTKVNQAISASVVQLGMGLTNFTTVGLLFGQLLYGCAGIYRLLQDNKEEIYWKVSLKDIRSTFIKYCHYPKYSIAESLFNTAGVHLPILLIAFISEEKEAGYLSMAIKIMAIPMVLIGTSISQVYFSQASEAKIDGNLAVLTRIYLKKLILIGTAPLIFFGILAADIFILVLGDDWRRSGEIIFWMTPWIIVQFFVSPISIGLHVVGEQKVATLLQLLGFILKVIFVVYAYYYASNSIPEYFAVGNFLFYLFYFLIVVKILNIDFLTKLLFNKLQLILCAISVFLAICIKGLISNVF